MPVSMLEQVPLVTCKQQSCPYVELLLVGVMLNVMVSRKTEVCLFSYVGLVVIVD